MADKAPTLKEKAEAAHILTQAQDPAPPSKRELAQRYISAVIRQDVKLPAAESDGHYKFDVDGIKFHLNPGEEGPAGGTGPVLYLVNGNVETPISSLEQLGEELAK